MPSVFLAMSSVSSGKSNSRNTHLELTEIEEDLKGYIELDIEKGYDGFHLRKAAFITWSGDAQGYSRRFGDGWGAGGVCEVKSIFTIISRLNLFFSSHSPFQR